jgi:signal transduction histidine kinase
VIAVARPENTAAFEAHLSRVRCDVAAARLAGRYVTLDAIALCDQLMPGATLDAARFLATVRPTLARVRAAIGDAPLHVYGELVDLLWARGKAEAVFRVEELWKELAHEQPFALLCGYRLDGFAAGEHSVAFDQICAHHDADADVGAVALAQRARALEAELERRARLERRMQALLELTGALAAANAREDVIELTIGRGSEVLGALTGTLQPTVIDAPQFHRARAIVPLADVGALVFDFARELEPVERTLVEILGRQCALALDRVRLLEIERVARAHAEEATRAREEMLSVVSHELRNPLGTITLGAAALRNDEVPRTREHAERIYRQATRMARLIDDFVDFAGIQGGRLTLRRAQHPPQAIVSAVGELYAPMATERGLAFVADAPDHLPPIECDPERAVQVIANLVANAIKVTPPGGAIQVGAEMGDRVVFYVRDTGPGIAADDVPRLFERYWRSKNPSYKGAGLGLSIARGIVDAHGGRIWAESEVGVGTTFYFSL